MTEKNTGVQKAIEKAGSYSKLAKLINQSRLKNKTISSGTIYNWVSRKRPVTLDCAMIILKKFPEITKEELL